MRQYIVQLIASVATAAPLLAMPHVTEKRSQAVSDRITSVENTLLSALSIRGEPLKRMNLLESMEETSTPAVSIAVINNGEIEWAKAYGVTEAGSQQEVDTSTLFQAGSVSKPVAAIGALLLVQEGQLELDRNINDYLIGWRIPDNEYTQSKQVTLRHLLSHTSGCNVIGFDGYKQGAPLPEMLHMLDGVAPANNAPVRVGFVPGSKMAYSGGGYTVMQKAMEDVTGVRFADFMEERILSKLRLEKSSFHYPLPATAHAATAHPGPGLPLEGKWKNYPEGAAAGLWTTPTELATIFNEMSHILSPEMIEKMLTHHIAPYGLGPVVNGTADSLELSHRGRTDGFACGFVLFPHLKKGAVVMLNADGGVCLVDRILRSIASVYQWPAYQVQEREALKVAPALLQTYVGRYGTESAPNDIYDLDLFKEGDDLFVRFGIANKPHKLYATSDTHFFLLETGYEVIFKREGAKEQAVVVVQKGFERTFTKF